MLPSWILKITVLKNRVCGNGNELGVRTQIMNINVLCDGHPVQGFSLGTGQL